MSGRFGVGLVGMTKVLPFSSIALLMIMISTRILKVAVGNKPDNLRGLFVNQSDKGSRDFE